MRIFAFFGALFAGLAVATGAFGAHYLDSRLSAEMLEIWNKAARYQMYHALGLFVVAWQLEHLPDVGSQATVAGWSFVVGILLFSGSLYLLAWTEISRFGMITPLGGVAFLVGWTALAVAAL